MGKKKKKKCHWQATGHMRVHVKCFKAPVALFKDKETTAGLSKSNYKHDLILYLSYIYNIPVFQASPTCGFAVFRTHDANAMQTRHMSDCLRGRRGASNPIKKTAEHYSKQRHSVVKLLNATALC